MSIAPHLVVIGIGHVGSDVVTNAAALGLFSRISLIDVDKKVRDGQALDNHQATAVAPAMTTTITAADYDACRSADVIIVSAGPRQLEGHPRGDGQHLPIHPQRTHHPHY